MDKLDCAQRAQPSPRHLNPSKVIRDSNTDFWINPDSDPHVCQIAPRMSWIHYLVSVSHFAECHKNWPVTV